MSDTKIKLVLDVGHGGAMPGAVGSLGIPEKDVVLKVALIAGKHIFNHGIEVVYTRMTDIDVSLQSRCDIANTVEADYFISIHANSHLDKTANGVETFYSPGDLNGLRLAQHINYANIAVSKLYDRGVKTADFYVLNSTNMTAILHELAFVSNEKEQAMLISPEWQEQWGIAIAQGFLKFLNIKWEVYMAKIVIVPFDVPDASSAQQLASCYNLSFKAKQDIEEGQEYIQVGGSEPVRADRQCLKIINGTDRFDTSVKVANICRAGNLF